MHQEPFRVAHDNLHPLAKYRQHIQIYHTAFFCVLLFGYAFATPLNVLASCENPTQKPVPFVKSSASSACPSGYAMSGNNCTPSFGARFSIERDSNSSCPSRYSMQGNFCIANEDACHVFKGNGNCPARYSAQGNWCVSN